MKKFFIFSFLILSIFSFKSVFAAGYAEQPVVDESFGLPSNDETYQWVGYGFSYASGTTFSARIKATNSTYLNLYKCAGGNRTTSGTVTTSDGIEYPNVTCSSPVLLGQDTSASDAGGGYLDFSFNTNEIQTGDYLYFALGRQGMVVTQEIFWSTKSYNEPHMQGYDKAYGKGGFINFLIGSVPTVTSFQMLTPSTTEPAAFATWKFYLSYSSSTFFFPYFNIVATSTNTNQSYHLKGFGAKDSQDFLFYNANYYLEQNNNYLRSNDNYDVYVELKLSGENGVVLSTISRNVTIGGGYQFDNVPFYATSSINPAGFNGYPRATTSYYFSKDAIATSTCENVYVTGGILAGGLCDTVVLMVKPTEGSSDYLGQQLIALGNVFPFSVVTSVGNGIYNGLNSANISNRDFNLPFLPTYASAQIPILTSSTLSDLIGQDNKQLFFEMQKNVFWFATGLSIAGLIVL